MRITFTFLLTFLLILQFIIIELPIQAQTQNQQETLNQFIEELQKNPNDNALREKIIKFVLIMNPAPPIPEDARRHYVIAKTLFSDAKNSQDFQEAIDKFNKALLIAPWWSNAILDLGIALEANKDFDNAIIYLKLFIACEPGEELIRKAQDEIYIIEAKKEKAIKEEAAIAQQVARDKSIKEEKEKAELAERELKKKLSSIEGNWIVSYAQKRGISTNEPVNVHVTINKKGNNYFLNGPDWFFEQASFSGNDKSFSAEIRPGYDLLKSLFESFPDDVLHQADGYVVYRGNILLSEDGKTINIEHDNVSIEYSREQSLFSTKYKFISSENESGWYKFTLERVVEKTTSENNSNYNLPNTSLLYLKGGVSFYYPPDWHIENETQYDYAWVIDLKGPKEAIVRIMITTKENPLKALFSDENIFIGINEARIHSLARYYKSSIYSDNKKISRSTFSNIQRINEYYNIQEKFIYDNYHFTRNFNLKPIDGKYILLFDNICNEYNMSETKSGFDKIFDTFKYEPNPYISEKSQNQDSTSQFIEHPFIGLCLSPISSIITKTYELPDTNGVLIDGVIPNSPAYLAGLKPEDVIINFNSIQVTSLKQFSSIINETPISQIIPILFIRDGESKKTNVTLIKKLLPVTDILK